MHRSKGFQRFSNMADKHEDGSASRAQDQETQTNFDVNTNSSVRVASNHTQRPVAQVPRMHAGFPFRHPSSSWNRGFHYPPSVPYPDHCYSLYEGHYPPPHGHPGHYGYPQWHQPTSPVLGPNVQMHGAMHRPGYPSDGYHSYHLHNSMPPPGASPMITDEAAHHEVEIARPKPEWPSGHGHHMPSKLSVLPSDYLRAMSSRGAGTEFGGPPSTATSLRSTELEFPANASRNSTPRQRILSRKRALSNSPCSIDALDLTSIIRYSPDALLAYVSGSRASSASSFGHLITPIALSPANPRTPTAIHPCPVRQNPFITPLIPPLQSPTTTTTTTGQKDFPSSTTSVDNDQEEDMSCTDSIKASSSREVETLPVFKDEVMEECQLDSTTSPSADTKVGSDAEGDDGPGEVEQQELICHWKECNTVFESQEELVKHANSDHIKKERKDFTCYWKDCSREQRPFKAQYMLVVHMRRHTGEKPHKCTFEGCSKAYSRLENLKTHLRSHTGERPYMCEVEGCNKAFSNASDRAKHQNRTHSSVKPYVCKVPGCPKRYTDPSSLRKHTKTVHGEQGVKKLKTDNNREKPPQDQGKKNAPSGKPVQTYNRHQNASNAPQATQVKSVIKETRSGETKGSSYSGHVVGNSCDSDTVSSTCELSPGPADTTGGSNGVLSVNYPARNPGRSPRSPLLPNHLPGILEGEPSDGAVTTVQHVMTGPQSHGHLLPKIETKGKDVETWVRDVSRRMSDVTLRPNETCNFFEVAGDVSRRSSESGWSSYNDSRRSSQGSPFPVSNLQKTRSMDIHPYPVNTTTYNKRQSCDLDRGTSLQLTDMIDSNLVVRRSSEASTLSAPGNRLSRNSSGYGSQSNLAFLKLPPLNGQFSPPNGRFRGNPVNRRLSDTVICEADSSGMYMNGQGRELRRRSEPPGHVMGTSPRQEPISFHQQKPLQNFKETEETAETELITDSRPGIDPGDLDIYLTPLQTNQNHTNGVADAPQQTQRLRHYPYPEGNQFDNQQHHQEIATQVIHHRPNPPSQPKPRVSQGYSHHSSSASMQQSQQDLRQKHRLVQEKLYMVQQQQGAAQNHYPARHPHQQQPGYNAVYPPGPVEQQYASSTVPNGASYEDLMVDRMGALSTEADPTEQEFGVGISNYNMVINHMDLLLNSLAEEDKYLEMRNSSRIASALSGSMF